MIKNRKMFCRGFMALTAVMLLSSGLMAFSVVTMGAAASFADSQERREMRIRARLGAESCLEMAVIMAVKDYFLSGSIDIEEFDCLSRFGNDLNGNISINVVSSVGDISAEGKAELKIFDNSVIVVLKRVD